MKGSDNMASVAHNASDAPEASALRDTSAASSTATPAAPGNFRIILAFTLCLLWLWFVEFLCCPNTGVDSLLLRGISAAAAALALIAILVLSRKRPSLFEERPWSIGGIIGNVVGSAFIFVDYGPADAPLAAIGFVFCGISCVWSMALVGIAATSLTDRTRTASLSIGYVVRTVLICLLLLGLAGNHLPAILVMAIMPAVIYLLVRPYVGAVFQRITTSEAPEQLQVTHPASFLPFSSTLFVVILLFTCVMGYSSYYINSGTDYVTWQSLSFAPFLIAIVPLLRGSKRYGIDSFYCVAAALVIIGGLLLTWITEASSLSNVLMIAGMDCFSLFMYLLLFRLASRNTLASIPLILFGGVATFIGVVIDSLFWWFALTPKPFSWMPNFMALMVFLLIFIVYNIIFLRRFSFDQTVSRVEPVTPVQLPEPRLTFEQDCDKVAQAYHLTAREKDIMELLAHGRNSQAIQDKLVVSRNTVKTHVRNIYAKLDVHSQQELIDLVEKSGDSSR